VLTTYDTTYARISFANSVFVAFTYDTALYEITNLGLRLADPCFETGAVMNSHGSAQAPVDQQGQEAGYARTHALVVATTLAASSQWRSQSRAMGGAMGGATGVAEVGASVCAL
jgi:hypothetical protein